MERGKATHETTPSGLGRLTAVALVLFGLSFVYIMVALVGAVVPPLVVFAAGSLVIAAVVWRGWRWGPLLGAAWFAALFALNLPIIVGELVDPADLHPFVQTLVRLVVAAIGFAAGIGATVQNLRARDQKLGPLDTHGGT